MLAFVVARSCLFPFSESNTINFYEFINETYGTAIPYALLIMPILAMPSSLHNVSTNTCLKRCA